MKKILAIIVLSLIGATSFLMAPVTNATYDNFPPGNEQFNPRHPDYYDGNLRMGDEIYEFQYPLLTSLTFKHYNIRKLKEYLLLTSLTLYECNNISKLDEYPFLTSLSLIRCKNISNLKEYPLLTSLYLNMCDKIRELKEYPLLTSLNLSLIHCKNISELKEYPLLTSLNLSNCNISESNDYPLLTSLNLSNCNMSELKEYPLLTSLNLYICDIGNLKEYPLLSSLNCEIYNIPFDTAYYYNERTYKRTDYYNKICIDTSNKQKIQLYIKMIKLFSEIDECTGKGYYKNGNYIYYW